MDTYSILREIADSWVLLAMFAFFLGTCAYAFWPTAQAARDEASMIPFRHDLPAAAGCENNCDGCGCDADKFDFLKEDKDV